METVLAAATVCSVCGERVNLKAQCLACLLRAGLDDPAEHSSPPPASLVFGDFEIARREDGSFWELGCGAMGVTYRAMDKVLHRNVALKVIETPTAAGDSRAVRERFLREARAAAALKHPNVAGIFQFGASPEIDRCYYAMELVEGETLEALVRRDGPLKVELALEIASQVARALIGAAAQGLIHRDLKPGNIMITRPDRAMAEVEVKVIDFGLAKTTNAVAEMDLTHGGFIGTPSFASPEQFGGAPADARSDIFSLGATLWYALTGNVPYPGKTIAEIQERQKNSPLPVEQLTGTKIPGALTEVLRRALELDPKNRPASARELLGQLQACRTRLSSSRFRATALAAAAVVLVGAAILLSRGKSRPSVGDKSIAVLPFENLGDQKEDAFFASGVQDEILSDLARIADLKVISRTSVMQYGTNRPRNVREIGRALGTANLVEGTVQRNGNRVRVSVQLIDSRDDTHRWTEHYDREVTDIFAIQDEIAEQIAHQLQAKIARQEKAVIEEKPTSDLTAYAFYEQAKSLTIKAQPDREKRIQLLQQAVQRDPNFILARCLLAKAYTDSYITKNFDSEDTRDASAARAEETIKIALHLRPDRGEPHLAAAYYYFLKLQNTEARRELNIALGLLPNDAQAVLLDARLDRRENRWDDALIKARRAADLDPRNQYFVVWIGETYLLMRRYHEGEEFLRKAKERNPDAAGLFDAQLADFKLAEGDFVAALQLTTNPVDRRALEARVCAATYARDYATALQTVAAAPKALVEETFELPSPNSMAEATIFRAMGEREKAQPIFQRLRKCMDEHSTNAPKNEWYYAMCSEFDAGLGRREEAIREARQAIDMHPVAQDPINGSEIVGFLAKVYAWTDDRDRAVEQLEILSKMPSSICYGDLRFNPDWDTLRGDPRFEKIVASLAPKQTASK
jgi:serine/threonine protein kinase